MTLRWWAIPLGLLALAGVVAAVMFRIERLRADPDVAYLESDSEAEWIRPNLPFNLIAIRQMDTSAYFVHRFATSSPLSNVPFTVHAFRRFEVSLDGKVIFKSNDATAWKTPHSFTVPETIAAGAHTLVINVKNHGGPPCLMAYSKELGIRTNGEWKCSLDGKQLIDVIPVTDSPAPDVALQFPTVSHSIVRIAPVLIIVFLVSMAWTLRNSWSSTDENPVLSWRLTPSALRWILLGAWVALGANNIWQLPVVFGHDFSGHVEYVKYVANHGALPLATDGWQMFQSPLFYLIASPFYALLSPVVGDEAIVKLLRVLPLLCGLAQIELVYRCARVVFPDKDDLQSIATLAGGLMPMQIYMSQVIGNEPLAGCTTALLILLCFQLLATPTKPLTLWFFVAMGAVWGLALLSKVTPFLLAPLIPCVVLAHTRSTGGTWGQGALRNVLVFGTCLLMSGWYFLRNWLTIGKPFAGGWDPATGNLWWQEPSYRTWSQFTSFGISLQRPVWSSSWSLWDALYSTMWLDGSTSSLVAPPQNNVWNVNWMVSGAWLALIPCSLMFASLYTMWTKEAKSARRVLLFSLAAIGIYLAAVIDLYARLPIYSTAKASYTLGLLPCYAILTAAGAIPLLSFRIPRAIMFAALSCWGVAAYLAYFAMTWG